MSTAILNERSATAQLDENHKAFLLGFAEAAIFTATVEYDGDIINLDDSFGLGVETHASILTKDICSHPQVIADCLEFIAKNYTVLHTLIDNGLCSDWSQHGHDFLLTRDHHATGFWDRGYEQLGDHLNDAAEQYSENCFEFWLQETRTNNITLTPQFEYR